MYFINSKPNSTKYLLQPIRNTIYIVQVLKTEQRRTKTKVPTSLVSLRDRLVCRGCRRS